MRQAKECPQAKSTKHREIPKPYSPPTPSTQKIVAKILHQQARPLTSQAENPRESPPANKSRNQAIPSFNPFQSLPLAKPVIPTGAGRRIFFSFAPANESACAAEESLFDAAVAPPNLTVRFLPNPFTIDSVIQIHLNHRTHSKNARTPTKNNRPCRHRLSPPRGTTHPQRTSPRQRPSHHRAWLQSRRQRRPHRSRGQTSRSQRAPRLHRLEQASRSSLHAGRSRRPQNAKKLPQRFTRTRLS